MLRRPFHTTVGDIWTFSCNSACPYFGSTRSSGWRSQRTAKSCLSNITHGETETFVEQIVGEMGSESSSGVRQRKYRLEDFFYDSWTGDKTFVYDVGRNQVCEMTCAFLLGYAHVQEDGKVSQSTCLWKEAKKAALTARSNGLCLAELRTEDLRIPSVIAGAHIFFSKFTCDSYVAFACLDAGGKGDKGTQARGFIQNYLKVSCDFGPVPGDDGQSLTFVPFLNAKLFYDEYEMR